MLTIVGHKFGAPKGVAALYIRKGVQLGNFFFGGGQVHSVSQTCHGDRAYTRNTTASHILLLHFFFFTITLGLAGFRV